MPEKKPKLELELNKPVRIELMNENCLQGTSHYGEYYLYSVRNGNGQEYSFFPDKEVHEKIKDLRRGDKVEICKRAEQKGTKIVTSYEVKVLSNHSASSSPTQSSKDNYFETMLTSYQDAQKIQEELNGMVDVNRIAITLFIARSKISPNGYN
ncbi:MAG: hypothetical protein IPM14_15490 [bacterium]|nr:hypothetical protein [bacterium]